MTRGQGIALAVSAAAAELAAAALLTRSAASGSAAVGVAVAAIGIAGLHALGALAAARWLDHVAAGAGLGDSITAEHARRGSPRWRRGDFVFGLTVAFFVPVLGPIGLALLLRSVGRAAHAPLPQLQATLTHPPTLPVRPPEDAAPALGDGALGARLRFARDPDVRVQSALATRRLDGARANRLLRVALRDGHEDVRLLAYALLEDRERQADERIQQLQRELVGATTPERRAALNDLLAHAHWEVCYQGLVAGELQEFELARARAHLEAASTTGTATAGRLLLRARLLLRQGDPDGARAALGESRRQGMPARTIDPYLAECAFVARSRNPTSVPS